MPDATQELLAQLNDPTLYTCKSGVPVFCEHVRKGVDGKQIKVDKEDLEEIAENMQRLEKKRGLLVRMIDGHIKTGPETDEKTQPSLLGFWKNFRTGTFQPTPEAEPVPCVLADAYYKNSAKNIVQERPYRSAEYLPWSKQIRGVALLLRDPYLDLGTVLMCDSGEPVYAYSMENVELFNMPEMMPPTKPAVPAPAAPAPAHQGHDLSPEEVKHCERYCRYMGHKGYIKYDMGGGAMLGAMNGSLPAPGQKPSMNEGNEVPELYEALKADIEEVRKENATLKAEAKKARAETLLKDLKRKSFDYQAELDGLVTMDEKAWPGVKDRIVKHHADVQGAPDQIEIYEGNVNAPETGPMPEALLDKIVQYQRDHTCGWDEAKAAVEAGKK